MDKIRKSSPQSLAKGVERAVAKSLSAFTPLLVRAVHDELLEELVRFMTGPASKAPKPEQAE